jgi:hypothetical protein
VANGLPADLVDEVQKRLLIRAPEIAREVVRRFIRDDGTAPGDEIMSRGERIARFQDYAMRGVLDYLKTVKPDLLDRMVKQYEQDITASPLVRPRASSPAPTEPPMMGGY